MYCILAQIHKDGSQNDIIQRENSRSKYRCPEKRRKPILNWKENMRQKLHVCSFYEKSFRVYYSGEKKHKPTLNELKEAQREVYKGYKSTEKWRYRYFSGMKFTLTYRHYSEKNFKKEDVIDHSKNVCYLSCQSSLEWLPFNQ